MVDREELILKHLREAQAQNILNTMYYSTLCGQLAWNEQKKKGSKAGEKGKLMGDGLPQLLLGDKFFKGVVDHTEWQE